ncbi:MAG: translation initiation factor IF-2 [Gammaproteobacteria bacterium]|nr:translation initiation factor IF-2 [Gammaproteobacteria bacterium]
MRVIELARDLRVSSRMLLTLLRKMGVALHGDRDFVPGDDVSRLLARIERERRQSGFGTREAVQAALEDVRSTHVRRRRSRRRIRRVAPSEAEVVAVASPVGTDKGSGPVTEQADSVQASGGTADGSDGAPESVPGAAAGPPSAGDATEPAEDAGSAGHHAPNGETSSLETTASGPDIPGGRSDSPPAGADQLDGDAAGATAGQDAVPADAAPAAQVAHAGDRPGTARRAEGGSGSASLPTDHRDAVPDPRSGTQAAAPTASGASPEATPSSASAQPPAGASSDPGHAVAGPDANVTAAETFSTPARPKLRSARSQGPEGPVRVVRQSPRLAPAASAGPGGQVRIQAEGYGPDGRRKRGRKKGRRRQRVDQGAVQENIQRVMAELKGGGRRRRKSRDTRPRVEEKEARKEEARKQEEREATTVRVNEFLTVAELGELIDISSTELIGSAFKSLGLMVTINQRLDFDQIEMLLEEFNFTAVREQEYGAAEDGEVEEEDDPELALPRPPVVTVMGHVDHGKTKLLDSIRDTNVVAGESGGITQHIGAYHVQVDGDRSLTFLDTPGHAAFTAMRARGADVTDIVILVVAADDSVMPQTVEAISHARNAGVPIVVAINKMDLPAADAERVKQQLLSHDVTVEDFGGDVLVAPISARTGAGMDELLEKVLLQAELLELKANPNRPATGAVIEARLDVGKGPVVSVLVQRGTLRVGDDFICGKFDGRVRALLDERGAVVEEVGPGTPVQLLGVKGVPQAGDTVQVMEAMRASEIASTRQRLEREKLLRIKDRGIRLGDFSQILSAGEVSTLPLIIKGDVDGSVQAVSDTLQRLSTAEVRVEIVHRAVGAINEEDVLLARTAGGVIIGFRVRPNINARQLAEREGVDIQVYDVIYDAENDVRAALEGMLAPERLEKVVASAEVRETFKVTRVGTIAGCYVSEGVVEHPSTVRLIRDGVVVYTGEISSLKRFKDDVKLVRNGLECGIGIANYNDVKVGDVIECFVVEEVARTLAGSAHAR